jgi:glutamate synthase (NADPH/NADH) small chain
VTDPRGFLQLRRRVQPYRPVQERLGDYAEQQPLADPTLVREQAQRCMDCGVPFCHSGCPLGNLIPDWNDLVHRDDWRAAIDRLHATNNFPEFTGKLCPAPCEEACVLALNDDAVTIKQIEQAIIDRAWAEGWVSPQPATVSTGRAVAVVGSGPAGLAAAQQLARAGHLVTVYERDDRPGGLLRYGIPDFKFDKVALDRRLEQLRAEGVRFETGVSVGRDIPVDELRAGVDALILATGAQRHRDLELPGRELAGVEYAMPYLTAQNRRAAGLPVADDAISAAGKRVVVLGGGDTSADCLGNALREGAIEVHEIAHGPVPPKERSPLRTWPEWPFLLRTYGAHLEGGVREWQLETSSLEGDDGRLQRLVGRRVEFPGFAETGVRGRPVPVDGGEVTLDVDLVLLAIGFTGVEADDPVYEDAGVTLTPRTTIAVDGRFATDADGVWACGDCVRGADLIVTAIADGRECARAVDQALQGRSFLAARERPRFVDA